MKDTFNKVSIAFFAGGIVVGLIIGAFVFKPSTTSAPTTDSNYQDNKTDDTVLNPSSNVGGSQSVAYSVRSQNQAAGSRVTIPFVSMQNGGWVAIREDNSGEMGNILGAQKLSTGVHTNVTVDLLRDTESGRVYHVVVYEEDGDGVFDQRADTLVAVNGQYIDSTFVAN